MKFGLALNANETISDIVRKSVLAERLGIDYLWVADSPMQLYAPAVAAAVANGTKRIKVGLGLVSPFLHSPVQIASSLSTLVETYGERFELCIGPGDGNLLKSVGVSLHRISGVANHLLSAKNQMEKGLRKNKVECKIWLGAQGPKVLRIARFFDGVLLNYAHQDLVEWAVDVVGSPKKKGFQFGIFAPSYIYTDFDPRIYQLLRIASATVALGAAETVLRKLNLYQEIAEAKRKLEAGAPITSVVQDVPLKTLELFSVFKPSTKMKGYLTEISNKKIEHVVFAYPQNHSEKMVQELAHALKDYRRDALRT